MELAFLAGRIIAGIYFLQNAYNHLVKTNDLVGYAQSKRIPSSRAAVIGSGILLLLGGLSLLVGMYLNIGIFLLIIFLLPVSMLMHAFWKETDSQSKAMERIQFMKNMALVGLLLMLLGTVAP